MKKTRYIFFSVCCLYFSWIMTGCVSEPKFSLRPDIDFDKIEIIRTSDQLGNTTDSVTISVKFTDGDGDLGVLDQANDPDNYFINVFLRRNNQYVEFQFPNQELKFGGKFSDLSDGATGPIQGTLLYSFNISPAAYKDMPKNDIWKFQVYLKDRAGNYSDTVFTDSIRVNID